MDFIAQDFNPGSAKGKKINLHARVKRTDATLDVAAGLDMAVVISAAGNDNLYLSLGNSTSDAAWAGQPHWVRFNFDDPAHPMPT